MGSWHLGQRLLGLIFVIGFQDLLKHFLLFHGERAQIEPTFVFQAARHFDLVGQGLADSDGPDPGIQFCKLVRVDLR